MNWIVTRFLGYLGRRLDGYKTKIGGLGLILSGLVGLINLMFPDTVPFPPMDLESAVTNIAGGFAVLGIGGKLEKQTAAVANGQGRTAADTPANTD